MHFTPRSRNCPLFYGKWSGQARRGGRVTRLAGECPGARCFATSRWRLSPAASPALAPEASKSTLAQTDEHLMMQQLDINAWLLVVGGGVAMILVLLRGISNEALALAWVVVVERGRRKKSTRPIMPPPKPLEKRPCSNLWPSIPTARSKNPSSPWSKRPKSDGTARAKGDFPC